MSAGYDCVGWIGQPSQGKSYSFALQFKKIVVRNASLWDRRKVKQPRKVMINMNRIDPAFLEKYKDIIVIEKDIRKFELAQDSDLFIDEIARYYPARRFSDLTEQSMAFFQEFEKRGNAIYFTTQVLGTVDNMFRSKVKVLRYMRKFLGTPNPSPTLPEIKNPWAVFGSYRAVVTVDDNLEEILKVAKIPKIIFSKKDIFKLYSRREIIEDNVPRTLQHIEYYCERYQNPKYIGTSCYSKPCKTTHK